MTRTAAAPPNTAEHDRTARPVVPAPRRSPEQDPEPAVADESYGYPLIRYAMEHATALHPNGR